MTITNPSRVEARYTRTPTPNPNPNGNPNPTPNPNQADTPKLFDVLPIRGLLMPGESQHQHQP